jgi:ankyrin repeat protein
MRRHTFIFTSALKLLGVLFLSGILAAATSSPVADAAMAGDAEAVRTLLKNGEDVNAAHGDGLTALHWAAMKGDVGLTEMLLHAGANVKATTRLGGFTPIHLAARGAGATIIAALVAAGANVNVLTSNGATPLMFAAAAGDAKAVTMLVENGAKVDATDRAKGETALMYAAAYNRVEAVRALLQRGANPAITTSVTDLFALTVPKEDGGAQGQTRSVDRAEQVPGYDRPFRYNELIGSQGGFSALQFACRQGFIETAKALIDGGAEVNQANPGDESTPLITAIINGRLQ